MEVIHFTNNTFVTQCLVCSSSSMSTFVDLSLFTSRTSHSETPIKEKIKYILNNKWISASETSFSLCLPCFHLIDQFDGLEIQLKLIQDEICNKYISNHGITQPVQTDVKSLIAESNACSVVSERVKRTPKRTVNKRKKFTSENIPTLHAQIVQMEPTETRRDRSSETPTLLQWHTTPVAVYDTASAATGGAPLLVASLTSPTSALPVAWSTDNVPTGDACCASDPGAGLRIYTLESQTQPQVQLPVPPLAPLTVDDDVDDPGLSEPATPSSVHTMDSCTTLSTAVIPTSLASFVAASRGGPPPLVLLPRSGEQALHSQAIEIVDDQVSIVDDQVSIIDVTAPPQTPASPWVPQTIYDETLEQLREGERIRVGVSTADGGAACSFCPRGFPDEEALLTHAHEIHRPTVLTANIPPHLGLGEKMNCGFQMDDAEPVTSTDAYARPFACLFCDAVFKFKSNIHLHFKEKHTPHKPFVCPDCSESYRRSLELSRHRVYYCLHRKKAKVGVKIESIDSAQ